jgi:hypothetical protein
MRLRFRQGNGLDGCGNGILDAMDLTDHGVSLGEPWLFAADFMGGLDLNQFRRFLGWDIVDLPPHLWQDAWPSHCSNHFDFHFSPIINLLNARNA